MQLKQKHFYGGKQAKLESAGDDLDQEFFAMGNVEGKLNTPFHKRQFHCQQNRTRNTTRKIRSKRRSIDLSLVREFYSITCSFFFSNDFVYYTFDTN